MEQTAPETPAAEPTAPPRGERLHAASALKLAAREPGRPQWSRELLIRVAEWLAAP